MNFEPKVVTLKNGKTCQITDIKREYFDQIVQNFYSFFDEVDEDINRLGPEVGILVPYTRRTYEEEKTWFADKLKAIENDMERARVAIVDGRVVGLVDVKKDKNVARIHIGNLGISVIKEYRGLGVGKALMEDILRIAKGWVKIVTLQVFADNVRAYNLYKKVGFEEYGRLPDGIELRGKSFDEIYMYKKIVDY